MLWSSNKFCCQLDESNQLNNGADTQTRTGDLTLTKGALYRAELYQQFRNRLKTILKTFCLHFLKVKINLEPGDVLLSHGETPHYHRRYCVSLLSSAWNQVGPQCYGRQANFKIRKAASLSNRAIKVSLQTHSRSGISESTKPLGCCMVKPHGQLVQVSSMPRSTYTPCLSTS